MIKEQQEFCQYSKIQQKFQFSSQDKRILNQSSIKALNAIQKQLHLHKKIFINVIGLNKNGKSVLCNEFVDFQFEDQKSQTVEYIFPSHNDPMTTGKIHFETKFLVDQGQLFYLRKQFQRQIRASFQRPSQQTFFFQTINQAPGELYKDQFKVTDIKGNVLSSFRYEHALWRKKQKQLQDLTMRRKSSKIINSQIENIENPKQQTLKTLAYFFQMMRWIQNDFSLSKYAVIVDHPGLNEYYQKTITNKMNEMTLNKEQKQALKQKQKPIQQKKIEEQFEIIEDDYVPRIMNELKFKESQIIIYCSSHVSGLFNYDHEQNIRKLFQQNNPDQIVLAFCFIRSIQPGKYQKIKTQTSVYKNIFQIIPLKTIEILKKIILESQKNVQYKTFIGPSKIQKLIKIKQCLLKYLECKNNYYQKFQLKNQIDSMSPLQKQQKKDRMFFSQEQTIRDLLKIYPSEWFHFYGLRQQQITSSIKSLQYIDQICKQNLKSTLKKKMGIIFQRGFKQMQDFFKVVDRQIQIETKKINLSDNKKNAIEEFYLKIRSSFMRFQDLYYKLQTEYSIKVQEQFADIRKMYQKLIDKNYQKELKGKFRLSILLEKEIKTSILNCFNEATLNISKALEKFKKDYNQFVWNEFQQFLKIFKKLVQSLMSMMHLKEKSQEKQITEQIVTNYKKFLTSQLFEDVSKKITQWNQFLEYNQKSFQATTIDLNFYKIMSFKEVEDHFSIQKVYTESFWSKLLMPIYGTVNHLKIIFQKQTDSKYYEQEWGILNQAIEQSIQASKLVKMNNFNFDKIVEKAQEEYIYKNKTVEKLSSIYDLADKIHNLKTKLYEIKQKHMLILFPG